MVGVALIIDGARRVINDPKALSVLSSYKDMVIDLKDLTARVVASSIEELQGFIEELKKLPEDKVESSLTAGTAALGAGVGASVAGAVAAGSVTVLGSHALGGVAISLGLVSAPVWPVVAGVAGVAGGAGVGYAVFKALKYWSGKSKKE